MKRSRTNRRSGTSRDTDDLLWLANGLAASGSRAEDMLWEQRLNAAVDELLQADGEEMLTSTLDQLNESQQPAYDVLADAIETRSEQHAGKHGEILLIAAPILAWSRFAIPACKIPPGVIADLRVHLQAHVLAKDVKLGIADMLFSPDQLPQGYCDTAHFAEHMRDATLNEGVLLFDPANLPETSRFLSDLRYVLAAVQVQPGAPIFRWQEEGGSRQEAAEQWQKQGGACLAPLLAGCAMETVLPDAYFSACRAADRASRAYSIRASVAFLSTTLEVEPGELRAVVAPFYENEIEEFRIGFTTLKSTAVVHGLVWPLLGPEDDAADVPAQIDVALKENGITRIEHIDNRFPLEYCDDCGAPMYPSPEGEVVHAELPEDKAEQVPKHLH